MTNMQGKIIDREKNLTPLEGINYKDAFKGNQKNENKKDE